MVPVSVLKGLNEVMHFVHQHCARSMMEESCLPLTAVLWWMSHESPNSGLIRTGTGAWHREATVREGPATQQDLEQVLSISELHHLIT